ncbi:adenylate/guanylate cyclase domain-containing protein [Algoriphagus sp. SE2]|uniref:adenylate/guanylate cyclase domain-containing protein n=1 Tax=Algoriphagus sp. SE2 TaxID=3141536 RepID=UPI0031CD2838
MFRFWPYFFLIFFFLLQKEQIGFAQEQAKADSLVSVYDSLVRVYGSVQFEDELRLLDEIAISQSSPEDVIYYSNKLIERASKDSVGEFLVSGFLQKGNGYKLKGDYSEALESYFTSIELAQRFDQGEKIGAIYISIGDTYSNIKDYETSDYYYDQGIQEIRNLKDSLSLGKALLNTGDSYFYANNLQKAIQNFREAKEIFTSLNFELGIGYSLGNLGMVYSKQQKNDLARESLNEANEMLEKNEDFYAVSVYNLFLSDIDIEENNLEKALFHAQKSLNLAEKHKLKKETADASLKLFELHNKYGNRDSALFYHLKYIAVRDSIRNLEEIEKIAQETRKFEVSQKQKEVDLLNQIYNQKDRNQKIIIFSTAFALMLIGILAAVLYRKNSFIKKTNLIIEDERNKSDHLLKNILPVETVNELKEFGKVKAQRFDSVSVMFTDFKSFTIHAEHLSPEVLVQSLDYYFSYFDQIVEKYELEKIKTLGDSYMCASGLPFPQEDHAERIVLAALEMVDFVEKSKKIKDDQLIRFDMRVGISSGQVVAGVVGKKKFAYDIWGDTVNCASRMESNSEVGKINISEDTHQLILDKFYFSDRGEIYVKNKGNMKMYFVEGVR